MVLLSGLEEIVVVVVVVVVVVGIIFEDFGKLARNVSRAQAVLDLF